MTEKEPTFTEYLQQVVYDDCLQYGGTIADDSGQTVYREVLLHVRDELLAKTLTIKDMRFVLDRKIKELEDD